MWHFICHSCQVRNSIKRWKKQQNRKRKNRILKTLLLKGPLSQAESNTAKAAIIQGLSQMPRDQRVKFLCAESTKEMMRNTITPHWVNKFLKLSTSSKSFTLSLQGVAPQCVYTLIQGMSSLQRQRLCGHILNTLVKMKFCYVFAAFTTLSNLPGVMRSGSWETGLESVLRSCSKTQARSLIFCLTRLYCFSPYFCTNKPTEDALQGILHWTTSLKGHFS